MLKLRDPNKWRPLTNAQGSQVPVGEVFLSFAKETSVVVQQFGTVVYVGTGKLVSFKNTDPEALVMFADDPELYARVYWPIDPTYTRHLEQEVYTSVEQRPLDSPAVLAATKAARLLELKNREVMATLAKLKRAAVAPASAPDPAPAPAQPVPDGPIGTAKEPAPTP